ncbi:MAG: ROK family protein [Anaerolineaceae bacterium]|nr:ROK family protein [Anaerolineaceae bacterium]MCY4023027.1 ROK family protein [Anaerolineaceae bacterium]
MDVLGIDIGGSGIKGAPVDTNSGRLLCERLRIDTPQPSTPDAVIETVRELLAHFAWNGPVGCTLPAIVKAGVTRSAANIDAGWVNFPAERSLRARTGCPLLVSNDADAAGIAEMTFGAGVDHQGLVLILTLGTGIGSSLFYRGVLVPNSELGHVEIRGREAEKWTANVVRKRKKLKWKEWGSRLDYYLGHLEFLFSPDLIILGGGVSRRFARFSPYLTLETKVVPAALRNDAGMIGAALAARALVDD